MPYCFPLLMNPFTVLPRLVVDAFPPRPKIMAVTTALLPPVKIKTYKNLKKVQKLQNYILF